MPEVVRAFLSPDELEQLLGLAAAARDWTPGRQDTGYDISPLPRGLAVVARVAGTRLLFSVGAWL
jgi:hypothetical protein